MLKRKYMITTILTILGLTAAISIPISGSQSTVEYDPWIDYDDDGRISYKDLFALAAVYGTSGDPITKAAIAYDSGLVDITDKAGQYFTLVHNLSSTEVIVDITGKTTVDGGVHQRNLGLTGYTGWRRTYGGTNNDHLGCIIQTNDGGYALAGYTCSFGAGGQDFWLVKTDSFGNVQWNKTYGRANDEGASSVVQTSDGGYALFGTTKSFGDTTGDFWLVKVDRFGNEQWNKTYSKAPRWDRGRSMAYCSDGGFILTGVAEWFGDPYSQVWLVKTNSTGDKEWNYTYGWNVGYRSTYVGYERAVIETSDGGYAVAGTRYPNPTYRSVWFFKTDENGTMLWHKTYGKTNRHDSGQCLVETPDGGYAIAGYTASYGAGGYDFWLIKTNSVGDKEWDKTYGGTNDDSANSVVQTVDGGYALAGYTYSFGAGGYDFWLVKTGVESGLAWTDSTADSVTLYRGATDSYWNHVRVRIWKIKETP